VAPSPDWPDYCTPISLYAVEVEKIPIDIVAQTIGTLSIDIKAQTLAQLNVNIAACAISLNVKTAAGESVSVGIVSSVQLNVNLAASAITVNVHETGTASVSITSSVQLDINIAASAISLNVKSAAGEHIDTDIVSSIQLSINIAASAITLAVHEAGTANVAVTSSVQLNVNIAASGINVPITTAVGQHIDTDIVSSIQLSINIAASAINVPIINPAGQNLNVAVASSVTLNISISASSINVPVTTSGGQHVDVDITSSITVNMNLQSSSITLNVNIASQSAFNLNVNIAASAVTLQVNIASQSVTLNIKTTAGEHVDTDIVSSVTINVAIQSSAVTLNVAIQSSAVTLQVNIASQSAFNLNVNIAASAVTLNVAIQSSAVTLNVNIASQSVDINIKTSGGANIIIDKLTQTAYTERRATQGNPTGGTPPSFETATCVGKFFPRGCRGFLRNITRYVKSVTGAQQEVWAFSPYPGAGEVFTATENWSGAFEGWGPLSAQPPRRFWNYDSLFIWLKSASGNRQLGYDAVSPEDAYNSLDSGVTWDIQSRRYYIYVEIDALTPGDVPVSGTLNVIHLPNLTAESHNPGVVSIPPNTTTTLVTHTGSGRHIHTQFGGADENNIAIYIYADDVLVLGMYGHDLQACGFGASTPDVSLIYFAEGEIYYVWVTARYPFKRQLRIAAHNSDGVNAHNAQVLDSVTELIS